MKIAIVTGTRAEYGIWRPVLDAISKNKALQLQLIVTGTHLQKSFGHTIDDIIADGREIAGKIPMYRSGQSPAEGLARGIAGMAGVFAQRNPDVVMVLGDRIEILAAACCAMTQGRIIAHLHGGETAPGQYDEQIRHAVTKMAHIHFCATPAAAARIRQMGENPKHIHAVGAPAIDLALASGLHFAGPAAARRPVLVLHPSTRDVASERRRTHQLIEILVRRFGSPIFTIGPNNDPGHAGILAAYRDRKAQVRLIASLNQSDFWQMLANSGLLIGNSSSGILEAATLGVAVINIGERQSGRERSGNVLDAAWSKSGISAAVDRVLSDAAFHRRVMLRQNVYGDGRAAPRIAAILAKVNPATFPRPKRFIDLAD